ncbi:MAG: hypothetical protein ACLSDI_05210 [Oscillospiraceae bacterium]
MMDPVAVWCAKRRVGHHPRCDAVERSAQPCGGGRQSHEAHEHCHEAAVRAAVPA